MKTYFLQKKILKLAFSFFLVWALFSIAFAMKSNHGLDGFVENRIDATRNARLHSNMGNIYFDEKKYPAALKEYEIAFNLAHKTPAAGAYLHNIARCYYVMGLYKQAQEAILGSIKKDCMNITYYDFLVDCIIKNGNIDKELNKYIKETTNPYNRIIVGLIYLKTGKKMQARATFDDFVATYPDMNITQDVKALLRQM
ncbi:MAG: tetratricopeptide repeat protein [Candidatus Gastranaerophilales bacterium]|nr:tetratricopeptide repeat protein [Candidatus Gastranaerophilales bacterium]